MHSETLALCRPSLSWSLPCMLSPPQTHDLWGTGDPGPCFASERVWMRGFVVLGMPWWRDSLEGACSCITCVAGELCEPCSGASTPGPGCSGKCASVWGTWVSVGNRGSWPKRPHRGLAACA